MSTAIYVRGARGVVLDNVVIRGFDKGIVLEDSQAVLNRVFVARSNVGLLARSSHAVVNQSVFLDNAVDVLTYGASLDLIDTFAENIIAYLSNVKIYHYAVNPYKIIAQARDVLKERDSAAKRRKFGRLLKSVIQYATYAKELYEIIKAILRSMGISLP